MDKAGSPPKTPAISAATAALLYAGAAEKDHGAAMVTARRGQAENLAAHLKAILKPGPFATRIDNLLFIGVAPESWLVLKEAAAPDWAQRWGESVSEMAAIVDVSSAYAIFGLRDENAREVLQKGLSIDLHPSTFPPGRAALSLIAQIDVIAWSDPDDGMLHVAVFRSMAESFCAWLIKATKTAELGFPLKTRIQGKA